MKKFHLRILTVIILTMTISTFACTSYAGDIPSDWAKDDIASAIELNIIKADDFTDFNENINREKFCEIIVNLYEILSSSNNGEELDTIVKGYGAEIAEDVKDIKNGEDVKKPEEPKPHDIDFKDTKNEAVLKAAKLGIVNGKSEDMFAPNEKITREEICLMISNLIDKAIPSSDVTLHKKYLFDDNTYISSWAKSAVDYSYYMGIIKGTDEYTITPLSNVTVEEAIVLANRILLLKDEFSVKTKPSDKMEWVIKPKFDGMMKQTRFAGGVAVVKKDGCFGYINQEGKSVTKFVYDDAFDFSEGRGRVEKDGKFGFVDKSGKLCIPIEYDSASDFSYGVVSVEKDGKFGFIDVDGNEVIPFEYESAGNFTEGVAPVMKNLKWGYIDLNNNEVIPFNFDWAGSFVEGYARVEKDTKYGFIKRDGTVSVECIYDYVYDYSCGRAGVYNKEYHGVIDENGKIIVPIGKYSKMGNYSENLLRVRTGGMWLGGYGFIDKAGEPSIRHLFKDAGDYSEGLVWYRIPTDSGDTHGYMNKNGDFILPSCEAERLYTESDSEIFSVNDFSEGLAAVTTSDGLMGFIKNPILK